MNIRALNIYIDPLGKTFTKKDAFCGTNMLLKYIVFNMNHNLRTASLYDIGSDTHLIRGCNVLTLIHVPKYANISQIQALCPKINTQNMELVYPCF